MSDEMRKDEMEEPEVEAHKRLSANEEPTEDESEDEVEAHKRLATPRLDAPRLD